MIGIIIEIIPHNEQRYETIGDWQFIDNNLIIKVSHQGDPRKDMLIAIHEFVEALLCQFNNPIITDRMVDDWDMSKPKSDDPGGIPEAPYHKQHKIAEVFEFMLAHELGIDWDEYRRA
jgi:hypothetical protein